MGETTFILLRGECNAYLAKQQLAWSRHRAVRREALEPGTAIFLFSGSLGLKSCHHNLGGDTSHVEISWPVVMDAQVLVAGFLCVAVGS